MHHLKPSLRSGDKGKYPHMLLVLGWWSTVLPKPSGNILRIYCNFALFTFLLSAKRVPHFSVIVLISLLSEIYVLQQTFKCFVKSSMANRQAKNFNVPLIQGGRRRWYHFFQNLFQYCFYKITGLYQSHINHVLPPLSQVHICTVLSFSRPDVLKR